MIISILLLPFRPEAMILLLFFVMYMAFMIVCAQSKSCPDGNSLQNSMNNSYISNDSAIAECTKNKWQYSKIDNQRDYNNNIQAIYGQFYFDDTIGITTESAPVATTKAFDERTPLVGAANGRPYEITIHTNVRQHANQHKGGALFPAQANMDSCSIDLGFAVKNSACLKKSAQQDSINDDQDEMEHENSWLSSKWILVPMFPLTLSLKVLTPLKFKNTCWTIWTFIVSIALIGALTYVSVWMVHLFGQAMGIPETVAGMTILSWGTGVPELIASIVLIRKTAQADMAICNTIGSNVIDASFCLSLPW